MFIYLLLLNNISNFMGIDDFHLISPRDSFGEDAIAPEEEKSRVKQLSASSSTTVEKTDNQLKNITEQKLQDCSTSLDRKHVEPIDLVDASGVEAPTSAINEAKHVLEASPLESKRLESVPRPLNETQKRKEAFIELAEKLGLTRDLAKELYRISGGAKKDVVTGYGPAKDFQPTLEDAASRAKASYIVEIDIKNLSGLNNTTGARLANEFIGKIAETINEDLKNCQNWIKENKIMLLAKWAELEKLGHIPKPIPVLKKSYAKSSR